MGKRRTTITGAIALTGAATAAGLVTLGSAAQAATFDPCAAANRGRLRYSTGSAEHVVFAVSSAYSSNAVVVTECARSGKTWKTVSQTTGRAGTKGFAAPGEKREGDGKSPTGSFTLSSAFGLGNPGTALPYRKLRITGDCWGSTPGASYYNAYYSGTCRSTDEDLSATMLHGPYRQVVVIDYNLPKPVAGYGSAIFFHVGGTTPTSGCISITEDRLRAIMRTLGTGDRMIMGPQSALFRS